MSVRPSGRLRNRTQSRPYLNAGVARGIRLRLRFKITLHLRPKSTPKPLLHPNLTQTRVVPATSRGHTILARSLSLTLTKPNPRPFTLKVQVGRARSFPFHPHGHAIPNRRPHPIYAQSSTFNSPRRRGKGGSVPSQGHIF